MTPAAEFESLRETARTALARHGVQVEVLVERTGAGLLVSGAFGHSRYREIVLGGVTRLLLERAQLPVLFAH